MDVLITTAPKDFNKLPFVVESIVRSHAKLGLRFFFVSPCAIPDEYMFIDGQYLLDREVVDFDFSLINMKHRRGWYRQQFIKLFQKVTSDQYTVFDSDIWVGKQLIDNERFPTFFIGKDQFHQPYFDLMGEVVNVGREFHHSFISEIMMFDRLLIQDMLTRIHVDEQGFFDECVKFINKAGDPSGFSEYELYGNYVFKYHPAKYQFKNIRVSGKALPRDWTTEEIQKYIKQKKNQGYDLLTMHSWL